METKGKTLEEVDAIFEPEKRTDAPGLEAIRKGEVDPATLEKTLHPGLVISELGYERAEMENRVSESVRRNGGVFNFRTVMYEVRRGVDSSFFRGLAMQKFD